MLRKDHKDTQGILRKRSSNDLFSKYYIVTLLNCYIVTQALRELFE